MATDGFFAMFFLPVLAGLCFILWAIFLAKGSWLQEEFGGFSVHRFLTGLLGALIGLGIYSIYNSYVEAVDRIAAFNDLKEIGVFTLTLRWSIYLFVLYTPFLILLFFIIYLPLQVFIASRLRLVSFLGVAILLAIFAAANAGYVYFNPYNKWCEANLFACTYVNVFDFLMIMAPVMFGFSIGARLPLLRS